MLGEMYTLLFVISFVLFILLISFFRDRISIFYVLLFSSLLVANFGYMQMADASSLEMAVYANQVTYLGSSFSPFFLIMCLADLCKFPIRRIHQSLFILFGCLIFLMTSSVGVFDWYYTSLDLGVSHGVSYLIKEYGPLHILYPMYLVIVLCLGVYITILSIIKKKDVSYVTSVVLLIEMCLTMVVYFTEKAFRMDIAILPVAYVIGEIIILILLKRISLYDVSVITAASMVESKNYGFVLLDKNGRYLGCDIAAKIWFKELNNLHVDMEIQNHNTEFLEQLKAWSSGVDTRESVLFEVDEKIIEGKYVCIEDRKRKMYCVYLRDDTQQQKYTQLVTKYTHALEKSVNNKSEKIQKIQNDIILGMASIVENRDNNTGGHIQRTSDIVRIFVNQLRKKQIIKGLSPETADCIIKAAPLHDFGKIGIPDNILNKPGRFNDEEYEIMKGHAEKGAVIVAKILKNVDDEQFKKVAINVAHYHHERWDGTGYPEGIMGVEIPFEARVMALADVFDALVSKRVYKEAFSYEKAFSIIEEGAGTQFDPVLCKAFLECRAAFEQLYNKYED